MPSVKKYYLRFKEVTNLPLFYILRETYEKIDLDKSYRSLFELLWYSQLPCFDIINITTKEGQEHGNTYDEYDYLV